MKELIQKVKDTLTKEGFEGTSVVDQLKELREYFKANLNEPGYVKMIRYAYEDIEQNGDYGFFYLEEEDSAANLAYFLDLLADYHNKYNREELQDIRNLMEGIEPELEETSEESEEL